CTSRPASTTRTTAATRATTCRPRSSFSSTRTEACVIRVGPGTYPALSISVAVGAFPLCPAAPLWFRLPRTDIGHDERTYAARGACPRYRRCGAAEHHRGRAGRHLVARARRHGAAGDARAARVRAARRGEACDGGDLAASRDRGR